MEFEKLFEPVKMGTVTLRNRIVMPAISTKFGSDAGGVTDRYRDYYLERAKGGVGLIIIENTLVEYPRGKVSPTELRIDNHKFIPGLNDLAESIKEYGAKVAVQLHHAGRQTNTNITEGVELVSASNAFCSVTGGKARALKIPEIQMITDSYAEGALRAKIARFDAVEIHAAHGYLISQFLSPFTNKRDDRYGKTMEGRCRFLLEIIKKIKDKVGDDFPIIVRISADEMIPEGYHLPEAKYLAKRLEEAGASALHVSAGIYESKEWIIQPMLLPPGCLTHFASEIKKEVAIPVIAVGRINDPGLAENILRQGKADLIAMGRPLIADPHLPEKAKTGRVKEIRKCLACNNCIGRGSEGLRIKCSINAEVGREKEYKIITALNSKKIAVIGGGPAGMEAARVAALRGHQVVVFEKHDRLGGQLLWAAVPPGKSEIKSLINYLTDEIDRLRVEVKLSFTPTINDIKAQAPDAVILATGSGPILDTFKMIGKKCLFTVDQILNGILPAGKRVAVLGGGRSGCETAHFLATSGKEVSIVEMRAEVGIGIEGSSRKLLLEGLKKAGVEIITGLKIKAVNFRDEWVEGSDVNGKIRKIPANDFVVAMGMQSNQKMLRELEKHFQNVYLIGDCQVPANILEAIHSGFKIGLEI